MCEPLNLDGFKGLTDDGLCIIEASCATGFEPVVLDEVKELLNCEGRVHMGRVIFDIPIQRARETLKLRTVNNIWVLVGHTYKFLYPESSEEQLVSLADFTHNLSWEKSLEVWRNVLNFEGTIYKDDETEKENLESNPKKPRLEDVPSFRCTCYRTGTNHKFKSTEAQISVGGRIHDKFGWNVKMKDYNIEVVINCDVDQVYVAIALTNKSLFYRTLTQLGNLALKPTLAASLVKLAKVEPGEVVLDPMCGGGSIPLEGALLNTGAFFLGGEINAEGAKRSRTNMTGVTTVHSELKYPPLMDCFQGSAVHPCFKDGCIDVIVTDLPFGRRSGSKADNRVLYPRTMTAMARLVRPETGRAILLTQDKASMFKTFNQINKYWKLNRFFGINIGGLKGLVFLFNRTIELYVPKAPKVRKFKSQAM